MLRKLRIISMTALIAVMTVLTVKADIEYEQDNNYDRNSGPSQIKIDRYLDVEVWTNHTDNEFYEGDNIVISYRTNRDAFVAIYTVDTRGRVNLLFPSSPNDNNFIEGGETYRLPDHQDDFDFVVSGPEGVETIQIIASKERFPIPDWYPTSGIIDDAEDRHEFMDYINSRYFVRYDGQRFAFDRASVYVNEWEEDYYRPTYYPSYPSWTVAGNVYIDYPYGGSVYINGVYWGVAPLYIPRIYVGWHTFTVYDPYGHCWEHDIHVTRYNTVVLNRTIINTSPNIRSKYKEVRTVGYRDPVKNGYPTYKKTRVVTTKEQTTKTTNVITTKKKYARGSTEIVKTQRGYETTGKTVVDNKRSGSNTTYERNTKRSVGESSKSTTRTRTSTVDRKGTSGSSSGSVDRKGSSGSTSGSGATYKRSTGKTTNRKAATVEKQSSSKKATPKSTKVEKSSEKSSDNGAKVEKKSSSSKQSKSSGSVKKSSSDKSSGGKSGKKKR